ncbi:MULTISPECIES: hypothetical protein [unclassified Lysinibacillus]
MAITHDLLMKIMFGQTIRRMSIMRHYLMVIGILVQVVMLQDYQK